MFSNQLMIRLRIKGRIKSESRTPQIHTNLLTKGDDIAKGFRQNRCIMLIDGFDCYRASINFYALSSFGIGKIVIYYNFFSDAKGSNI